MSDHLIEVEVGMPYIELPHLGKVGHRSRIGLGAGAHGNAAVVARDAARAAADLDTRRKTADVPLPGTRRRLVEVVDIKDQVACGAQEHAEVGDMRVTHRLHLDAGDGARGKVACHDDRRAAEERKGRGAHAAVAYGDEVRHARSRLFLEQCDGRSAVLTETPRRERLDRAA